MKYRGCKITISAMSTPKPSGSATLVPLYDISGRLTHNTGNRPFLTTIAEAKQWIDEQDGRE